MKSAKSWNPTPSETVAVRIAVTSSGMPMEVVIFARYAPPASVAMKYSTAAWIM